MMIPQSKTPAGQRGQESTRTSGISKRPHFNTGSVTDAMLARYLGVRRSRIWSLIARGDIARPNRDNGTTMSWSGLMLKLLARDIESGKVVHQ